MNIITYEKAYCLFPRATLEEHVSLLSSSCKGHSIRREQSINKYTKRGYQMMERIRGGTVDLLSNRTFPLGWRWIDDSLSWTIQLDTDRAIPLNTLNPLSHVLAHDPSAICNWEMRYSSLRGAVMHYRIIKTQLLRYRYLVTDTDLGDALDRYLVSKLREERNKPHAIADVWKLYAQTVSCAVSCPC